MRRYLVVANQTLGGDHMIAKIRECMASQPSEFYLLVPSSPSPDSMTYTEGEAHALAEERLLHGIMKLREIGANVSGEVGDTNPAHAVGDVCLIQHFDEIIVSTLPLGMSRWLKQDLPSKIQRQVAVPVTHIVGEPISVLG